MPDEPDFSCSYESAYIFITSIIDEISQILEKSYRRNEQDRYHFHGYDNGFAAATSRIASRSSSRTARYYRILFSAPFLGEERPQQLVIHLQAPTGYLFAFDVRRHLSLRATREVHGLSSL
jgi:hypothetical protein